MRACVIQAGRCLTCGASSDRDDVLRACPFVVCTGGPGTELSRLLRRFGIKPTPGCACRSKENEMDAWGCDECSKPERIEEVLAVMRDEAKVRGLPFVDMAGRVLVRRAIANARRKEQARAQEASQAEGPATAG